MANDSKAWQAIAKMAVTGNAICYMSYVFLKGSRVRAGRAHSHNSLERENMYFNFKLFSALTTRAYQKIEYPIYLLEDVLGIFEYYFQEFENTFKEVHPPIRMVQIERIIGIMPFIDSEARGGQIEDIEPDDYYVLIDKHFKTQYRNCDYNINHFFSGDIRLMRFYEELY